MERTLAPSESAILCVPMLFEIGDQRRAEMTISLLARVDGHVVAEEIERLFSHTKSAPIAGRTHGARTDNSVQRFCDSGINGARINNRIADHQPLGAGTFDLAPMENCLACDAVSGEPR